MAFIEEFVGQLLQLLTNQREKGWSLVSMRKPNEKLSQGDFSFPTDFRIWRDCFPEEYKNFSGDLFTHCAIKPEEIQIKSKEGCWNLPVEKVEVIKNRCIIFLDRKETFRNVLLKVMNSPEGIGREGSPKRVFMEEISSDSQTLTDFRGILLRKVLVNILGRSRKYIEVHKRDNADVTCVITSKSSTEVVEGDVKILPGVVLDSRTGKKLSKHTWTECLEQKMKECELVARHRYGFRGPGDSQAGKMFEVLGTATMTLELLEAKPTSPVAYGGTSSRGGAFILYNSARMETLLEQFKARNFPEAPPLEEIDFSLLSEPEEWILLLNFIASEEWMIEKCISEIEIGRVSPHLICSFLHNFVTIFSAYYRRVQILTDNRKHLLKTLHARIHLLRALRMIFNRTLALLDIQPVAKM
uniref:DALR anticodon binding domain-containing protein n=2 Tax=Lutzomyia longipalpis TaxID=7200 RepID=A0A1B0GJL2_LUTLO